MPCAAAHCPTSRRSSAAAISSGNSAGVHAKHGTRLGGLHLEMTGDSVTECLGGSEELA